MSFMIIDIEEPHREELQQMFPGASPYSRGVSQILEGLVLLTDRQGPLPVGGRQGLDLLDDREGDILADRSRKLDDFVRLCIGTFRRLEEHQAAGGVLYLGYPDGSLREMTVDREIYSGQDLPKAVSPLSPGMKRTIRRRLRR